MTPTERPIVPFRSTVPSERPIVYRDAPHPTEALTRLVSGYPDVKGTMHAILLEADEIIVKPFETKTLANLVHDKLLTRNVLCQHLRREWRPNTAALHWPYR